MGVFLSGCSMLSNRTWIQNVYPTDGTDTAGSGDHRPASNAISLNEKTSWQLVPARPAPLS
jgi:hypothetical protein